MFRRSFRYASVLKSTSVSWAGRTGTPTKKAGCDSEGIATGFLFCVFWLGLSRTL